MQFTASKHQICQALAMVARVVEKRTTIPILANVLLRADGTSLHVTATDLNIAMSVRVEPRIEQPGAITLPAKLLLDFCNLLPDGDIKFSIGENSWASITAGRSRTRIAGMSAESFPEVPPTPDGTLEVPVAGLLALVARTRLAITTEESRFTLNGALFSRRNESLEMVATDGHRLAYAHVPLSGAGEGTTKFLIPMGAIKVLPGVTAGAGTVKVSVDDNHIFFRSGGATLVARKLTGNFPDYERVLPKDAAHVVTVNRAEVAGAIARVAQFADERSHAVRLAFKDTGLEIFASSVESGESTDIVQANFTGEAIEIGFNASYISDFLQVVDAENVTMHLTDGKHAGEFRIAGSDEYRYILMPMRI